MFIAIEGADCCGKGVQSEFLADKLEARRFKFPDKNTPIGEVIYDHLFNRWRAVGVIQANAADDPADQSTTLGMGQLDAMVFQCMQLANRLEHACEISDLKKRGHAVVADRYLASGIVYGGCDGLDVDYLKKIQGWLPSPDVNILLDVSLEEARERLQKRGDPLDRYENEPVLKDTIQRYKKLWNDMATLEGSTKWVVVDGNKSKVEVAADIAVAVKCAKAMYHILK